MYDTLVEAVVFVFEKISAPIEFDLIYCTYKMNKRKI